MIDTHAHLQDEKFNNVEKIILNAKNSKVNKIVCASSSTKTSIQAVEIASKFDNVFATVGVHPEEASEWNEQTKDTIKKLAQNKKVVAIGEIGLDYYYEFCPKDKQKEVFLQQICLANELKLPIVVHTRDASGDTMQIIRQNLSLLKNGVVIHCYSMSLEILKEIMNFGFYISLGGAITFKNAKNLLEIVKLVNINQLMLETDCPYMSPEPYRGQINEPKNVEFVAKKIAQIKGLSYEDVAKITTENAERFFKI